MHRRGNILFGRLIAAEIALLLCTASCLGGSRLALVIGNDAYPEPWGLNSCVNDARSFAGWLATVGYEPGEIALITDANKGEMIRQLEALVRATQQRHPEQVVIYYSGHGSTIEDDNGDEGPGDNTDEVLVAVNQSDAANSPDEYVIRDDQFHGYIERIAAGADQLVVILDCCFSGGAIKGPRGGIRRPSKRISEADLYRMFAARGALTKGLRPASPTVKGPSAGLVSKSPLAEIQWKRPGKSLIFFSASNEFQEASAAGPGEQLSVFTAAFLKIVAPKTGGLTENTTLEAIHFQLVASLRGIQTPLLKAEGISTRTRFSPSVFHSSAQVERERRLSAIIEGLLVLSSGGPNSTWRVAAACDPAGPVAIGKQYQLRARPSHDGYLVVFTVEANGDVTFFYPNKFVRSNAVLGGAEVAIPGAGALLRAESPPGDERFYVYLSQRNPFEGFDFDNCAGALQVGKVDDVVRRRPAIRTVEDLRRLLAQDRGGSFRASNSPNRGSADWARAVVTVRTFQP